MLAHPTARHLQTRPKLTLWAAVVVAAALHAAHEGFWKDLGACSVRQRLVITKYSGQVTSTLQAPKSSLELVAAALCAHEGT